MRLVSLFLCACVLACAPTSVFAETKAVIAGPDSALPGELVVLNSNGSEGDNHKWLPPEGISTAVAGCEGIQSQIFFATPTPGKYTFLLIVTDKEAVIEYDTHTVTIAGSIVDPPPPLDPGDPKDPPPDDPTPVPTLKKFEDLSRANSLKLNDEATRQVLYASLNQVVGEMEAMCARQQCPTMNAAKAAFVKAIEDVLLFRTGPSKDVNWAEEWRLPNAQLIESVKIANSTTYVAVARAITNGLK